MQLLLSSFIRHLGDQQLEKYDWILLLLLLWSHVANWFTYNLPEVGLKALRKWLSKFSLQWTDAQYLSDIKATKSSNNSFPRKEKPFRLLMQQGECRQNQRDLWCSVEHWTGSGTSLPPSLLVMVTSLGLKLPLSAGHLSQRDLESLVSLLLTDPKTLISCIYIEWPTLCLCLFLPVHRMTEKFGLKHHLAPLSLDLVIFQ